jgi:urocanate hydratase
VYQLNLFRERLANEKEALVDLGSDQTSCHNPYHGGYYPVQVNLRRKRTFFVFHI